MSTASTILRNAASNWVGFAVNAAVTLFLTPFVLRSLGTTGYGIWILTSSIIGYYGLLDVGFRAGVTQYLTRYLAVGDYAKASECLSSAVAVLAGLGAMMVGLSVGAAYLAPSLFSFPPELHREAFWCILAVGGTMGVNFAMTPYMSVFMAAQRFDLANLIGVTTRLISAAAIVAALSAGYGLIGVCVASCGTNLLDYLVRWHVARGLVPDLHVSRALVQKTRLREIGAFGIWSFSISLNQYIYQYVPNLLIAARMPVSAVGHFALATGLSRQIIALLNPIGQVVYPTATSMHSRGDQDKLERLYHDGSRLMLLVMVSIVLIAGFWAEDFYRLWTGEQYLTGSPYHSVALVFRLLLLAIVTNYISNIGSQILSGSGRQRDLALLLLCGSAINVTATLLLIRPFGLLGVALGTLLASVVVDLIAMPLLVQRALGLSALRFLRRACVRPLAVAALQAVVIVVIRLAGPPHDWLHLMMQGAVAGISAGAVLFWVGISGAERRRFVVQPMRPFVNRVVSFVR